MQNYCRVEVAREDLPFREDRATTQKDSRMDGMKSDRFSPASSTSFSRALH